MRRLRLFILVITFILVPIFLLCFALFNSRVNGDDTFRQQQQQGRLHALLTWSTPSSLFPPSAIISLIADNSTFFLARPAAFGPGLPSRGLSGQLWIGKGFGEDHLLSDEELKASGFELGCSDVPGWGLVQQDTSDNPAISGKSFKKAQDAGDLAEKELEQMTMIQLGDGHDQSSVTEFSDGTDDHLHRPLADSNPVPQTKKGEPANASTDKSKRPVHADIESLQESAAIHGKVVLLSRGGCGFLEKVKWAQRRGGVALIVGDNERNGQLTIMYAKGDTSNITIPAIFTSYTSAHLLSSLVPLGLGPSQPASGKWPSIPSLDDDQRIDEPKTEQEDGEDRPIFTSTLARLNAPQSTAHPNTELNRQSWFQGVLQAVGVDGQIHEDARRPPGSGNIEWVQAKDWDEQLDVGTSTTSQATSKTIQATAKTLLTKTRTVPAAHQDDFVIGVQDWRDTEVNVPRPSTVDSKTSTKMAPKSPSASATLAHDLKETLLKGGSIIPGSGEYLSPEGEPHMIGSMARTVRQTESRTRSAPHGFLDRLRSWLGLHQDGRSAAPGKQPKKDDDDMTEGLWITLTPASVSASPFFDTLLVLVVSPLVTLTFVYGLLLLRSRIRRRRWRAPKSVVEQLPVRTYHTMSSASSTTSSQLPSQQGSPRLTAASSPPLRAAASRIRQRSQTTSGLLSTDSSPLLDPQPEKLLPRAKSRRYRGRQVECVVCLEQYVDGESKVMSLPCGHEFHADCITPWLVNRRRTCPICKGDVVRSLQRASSAAGTTAETDQTEPDEGTSDDIQARAATSVPETASAAIPIPACETTNLLNGGDVERGDESSHAEGSVRPSAAARWRGILSRSITNLSGETLRAPATPKNDRDR